MSFHYTQFGSFGNNLPRDIDGYVPEAGDDWRDFSFDFGSENSDDKDIQEYRDTEWWPEFLTEAINAVNEVSKQLEQWRNSAGTYAG